jgi:phosphatidate cytidylyltransferase
MERSLKNRLTWGSVMLAVLFGLLALDHLIQAWTADADWNAGRGIGGVGLLACLALVIPLAIVELTALFAAEQVRPYRVLAAGGAFFLMGHAFATQFEAFKPIAASTLAFIVVLTMLLAALRRATDRNSQEAIQRMAGTLLATLYLGGLAWFLIALRVKQSYWPDGSARFIGSTMTVLMILLVVKFTDIGAYFGGRAFGRHKLIPWLSPGKTWEGLFFGLATAGLVGLACAPRVSQLTWEKAIVFGVVIGGIGQLGDLLESMMKRDAEVKDSSSLIPGFGGILDVIDSPLLAAPFAYVLFSLF